MSPLIYGYMSGFPTLDRFWGSMSTSNNARNAIVIFFLGGKKYMVIIQKKQLFTVT